MAKQLKLWLIIGLASLVSGLVILSIAVGSNAVEQLMAKSRPVKTTQTLENFSTLTIENVHKTITIEEGNVDKPTLTYYRYHKTSPRFIKIIQKQDKLELIENESQMRLTTQIHFNPITTISRLINDHHGDYQYLTLTLPKGTSLKQLENNSPMFGAILSLNNLTIESISNNGFIDIHNTNISKGRMDGGGRSYKSKLTNITLNTRDNYTIESSQLENVTFVGDHYGGPFIENSHVKNSNFSRIRGNISFQNSHLENTNIDAQEADVIADNLQLTGDINITNPNGVTKLTLKDQERISLNLMSDVIINNLYDENIIYFHGEPYQAGINLTPNYQTEIQVTENHNKQEHTAKREVAEATAKLSITSYKGGSINLD